MSGFSNFLTNFSGGARNRSSFTDIISQAIFVPTFNTTVSVSNNTTANSGHINDGFIYLSNLLIQFSATDVVGSNAITSSNNLYTFLFPIDLSNSLTSTRPITIMLSGTGIVNAGSNSANPIVTLASFSDSNFQINFGNANGNFNWISIHPAPTTPIYTTIKNSGSISQSVLSVAVSGIGDKQYICDSSGSYFNNTYGYSTWTRRGLSTPCSTSKIVCCRNYSNVCFISNLSYSLINNNYVYANYYSSDGGNTFSNITITRNTSQPCRGIACDANNTRVYAVTGDSTASSVYLSTNVSGAYQNFNSLFTTNNIYFTDIVTDDTGQYVYVLTNKSTSSNGPSCIYKSSDYGINWTKVNITLNTGNYFNCITVDSTGKYSALGTVSGRIYISNDYCDSWKVANDSPQQSWTSITSDKTGRHLAACSSNSPTGSYYSSDYGENWVQTVTNYNFEKISMNSAGNIATAITPSNVYVSFNASN